MTTGAEQLLATVELLSGLPGDLIPDRLVADLTGLCEGQPARPRVVVLAATRADLGDLARHWLAPAGALPEIRAVRPEVTCFAVTDDTGALGPNPRIRSEVRDADAVVFVVDYADLTAPVPPSGLARLAPWTGAARAATGPDAATVAIDQVERSSSTATNRRDWLNRRCRNLLRLPPGWPDDGIVEFRAELARLLAAHGRSAGPDWEWTGLPAILARTVGPWLHDGTAAATRAVRRRTARTMSDLDRWCGQVLESAPAPASPLDPDRVADSDYARAREAWLVARGVRTLVRAWSLRS